jgi:hypothetical protein
VRATCIAALSVLTFAPVCASAEDIGQQVPADGRCRIDEDTTWTGQERFVWQHICAGKIADFNQGTEYGGTLDPRKPEGLPENRILGPHFLETILLDDKYRRAITRLGVRIIGARFTEPLDLHNADLRHELWLDQSLFEKDVDLSGLRSSRPLTLDGAKIVGKLDLYGARVDDNLAIRNAEVLSIGLISARVGHILDLTNTKVPDGINMNGLQARGVFLRGAEIGIDGRNASTADSKAGMVDLVGARIGQDLDMNGAKLREGLNLNGLVVDADVEMTEIQIAAAAKMVDFKIVRVGRTLYLRRSVVEATLDMGELHVGGAIFMDGGKFAKVSLANAHVGQNLDLTGSTVADTLDLSELQLGGDLFMREGGSFADVKLVDARIGGEIDMSGSSISGGVACNTVEVEQSVNLGAGASFSGPVLCALAKFKQSVNLATTSIFPVRRSPAIFGSVRRELTRHDGLPTPFWTCGTHEPTKSQGSMMLGRGTSS